MCNNEFNSYEYYKSYGLIKLVENHGYVNGSRIGKLTNEQKKALSLCQQIMKMDALDAIYVDDESDFVKYVGIENFKAHYTNSEILRAIGANPMFDTFSTK